MHAIKGCLKGILFSMWRQSWQVGLMFRGKNILTSKSWRLQLFNVSSFFNIHLFLKGSGHIPRGMIPLVL